MGHHLIKFIKSCLSILLLLFTVVSCLFSFSAPAQAFKIETETQPYFIKHLEKDRILSVSPNFRGELTQTSLLPSLTEISENYHIKATRAVNAEKLNGKIVPGLIVYVESKALTEQSNSMVATKP